MSEPRKILVTSALPYANGSIHLGHMLEYIQTDMWVRFQKHRGNQCTYVCADDAHGSAIMLRAEKEGITPEQLIANVKAEHSADFADFLVDFDNFHSTHSDENRELSSMTYTRLRDAGHIATRSITQYFDPEKKMFLADRFIKGTCPKCGTEDQYGDNCEKCGATYAPTDLKDPKSAISGATPVLKDSKHFFFDLPAFDAMLKGWTRSGTLQDAVANKIAEWLDSGLQQWDISAMRRTSASRFLTSRANTSMSGWTHRSVTWPASRTSVPAVRSWTSMPIGPRTRLPSCTISSARTS